jgi:hypothetical protein
MDDSQITQAQDALQEELRRLAELAPPSPSDDATPPQQAAQLARLHAAQAALRLAAALLRADDPAAAQALDDELRQLDQQVKAWKRKGQGWFETRTIVRTKIKRGADMSGEQTRTSVTVTYGPYRLFRWRDAEGKTRTHYLGKLQPTDEEFNPAPDDQLWAETATTAHNTQLVDQASDVPTAAPPAPAPPSEGLLWAESEAAAHNARPTIAPAPPSAPPQRQVALPADADQVGRLLAGLTRALGEYQYRTQISREKAQIVMEQMGDVLDQHEHAVMRHAVCTELHRQHWRGAPPEADVGAARLQAVMAMAARDGVAEELGQAVIDVGWELNDHRILRSWRHQAFVRMLRDSRDALAQTYTQARLAWRRVVDLGIDPTPQIDAGLAYLEAIHSDRQMEPSWEATPRRPPLAVVPALDDSASRHLTEHGQVTLCLRAVPAGMVQEHALGPQGCPVCVSRAQALGHICPCCGRPLTIPVLPDGLCLDCATTEVGQRYRAEEAARQERIAAQRGQRRKKRPSAASDTPPAPPPYLLSAEPAIPPIPPAATISPDPGSSAAALALTIAATTRHLTTSGERTLCGKTIDLATAVRQATFYSYVDCGTCARLAKAQGRICPVCGQPLLQVDTDGQCQVCVTARTRGW